MKKKFYYFCKKIIYLLFIEFIKTKVDIFLKPKIKIMLLLGLIFILLGTLFLLRNLGLLQIDIWPVFWPFLFILFGVYLVRLNQKLKTTWRKVRNPLQWKEVDDE